MICVLRETKQVSHKKVRSFAYKETAKKLLPLFYIRLVTDNVCRFSVSYSTMKARKYQEFASSVQLISDIFTFTGQYQQFISNKLEVLCRLGQQSTYSSL